VDKSGDDYMSRVWDLGNPRDDERSSDDWIQLARFYGLASIDSRGGVIPLTADEFRNLWQSLRAKFPEYFVASTQDGLAWHRREAKDSEWQRTWSSALAHLNALLESEPGHGRLHTRKARALEELGRREDALSASARAVALAPWDWEAWNQRGTDHAELGRWAEAKADFAKVLELDETRSFVLRQLAMIELALNNLEGYRQACIKLFARYEDSSDLVTVDEAAWICVLAADAVADQDALTKLVTKLVPEGAEHPIYLQTVGAANYRAGHYEAAVSRLNEGIRGRKERDPSKAEGDACDWLFLAMAHHRLGHPDEARAFHDKARQWIAASTRDQPADDSFGPRIWWQNWVRLQVLSREAETTLNGEKPKQP
jgi:tetratricopeptide (TPR) repeat protein